MYKDILNPSAMKRSLTMYLTAYFTCISRFDRYSWHKCAETEYNYHAYL